METIFKIGDRVIIDSDNKKGYIDAVTNAKVRIMVDNYYMWVYKVEIRLDGSDPVKTEIKKDNKNLKYLG